MLNSLDFTTLLIVFVTLVLSISLHEAMHAYTSYWLGDDTAEQEGRISLNPLRHVDPFMTILLPLITLIAFRVPVLAAKPVPFRPDRVKYGEFGAALVGFAGPLTNLALAAIGAGLVHALGGSVGIEVVRILGIFIMLNIGLFVFNMIPIPPLDGSRVLYAFAPEPLQDLMRQLETYGIFIVFALVLMVPGFTNLIADINTSILNFLI